MKDRRYRSQWYAVRCCCNPQKIFGFIELERDVKTQRVIDWNGDIHTLEIKDFCNAKSDDVDPKNDLLFIKEPAVYSDDRPIDFWRNIRGFVEIK